MKAMYCIFSMAVACIVAESLGSTPDWRHAGEIFFHQVLAILAYTLLWED